MIKWSEIAKRCKVEVIGRDSHTVQYRFDTVFLAGDYTVITLPLTFASEEVARYSLYATFYEIYGE